MFDFSYLNSLSKTKLFIYLTIFVFISSMGSITTISSVSYIFLLLFSLFYVRFTWKILQYWEKEILVGFVLFFIFLLCSLFNTHDVVNGIKMMARYSHFIFFIPIYLLFRKYSVEARWELLVGLQLGLLVMLVVSIYQVLTLPSGRAIGGNGAIMLGYASMLSVMSLLSFLLTVPVNARFYLVYALLIVSGLGISLMSGTKGAWLLFPVVVFNLSFLLKVKHRIGNILIAAVSILVLLVGASSFELVKKRIGHVVKEYQFISDNDFSYRKGSTGYRIEMWRNSIDLWEGNFWLGTGVGDFKSDRDELFNIGKSTMKESFSHAHNIYLHTLVTTGLVGLIVMFVFVFVFPFKMFFLYWKKEKDPWLRFYSHAGMSILISFFVFGLTDGWLFRSLFIQTYLFFLLVFMSGIAARKFNIKNSNAL